MKSIGARLQAAREEKGFSIEDIARGTNIARKYILALEAEDFSAFPAEAYVLGFLKNYGEYLGLNVRELHDQYRVLKIQEQPVPVNELLNKPSRLPRVIIRCIIFLAGGAIVFSTGYFILNIPKKAGRIEVAERSVTEHNFTGGVLEQRFFKGDSVQMPLDSGSYRIELVNLGEVVTLSTPSGNVVLGLNQDSVIDMDEDGTAELYVCAVDYVPNKPDMGVLLRFEFAAISGGVAKNDNDSLIEENNAATQTQNVATSRIIFSGANPYPFTLQVNFQGYCMFRWEILREQGRQSRNERYMVRGDEVNIQAQNGVRLWMSNAGAAKIQAIGGGRTMTVETGQQGAVVVADILWRRGEDGRYNLVFSRLEN